MGKGRDRDPVEKKGNEGGEMGRGGKSRGGQGRDGAKEDRRENERVAEKIEDVRGGKSRGIQRHEPARSTFHIVTSS